MLTVTCHTKTQCPTPGTPAYQYLYQCPLATTSKIPVAVHWSCLSTDRCLCFRCYLSFTAHKCPLEITGSAHWHQADTSWHLLPCRWWQRCTNADFSDPHSMLTNTPTHLLSALKICFINHHIMPGEHFKNSLPSRQDGRQPKCYCCISRPLASKAKYVSMVSLQGRRRLLHSYSKSRVSHA